MNAGWRESTPRLRGAARALKTADLPCGTTGNRRTEERTAIAKTVTDHASTSIAPPATHPRTPRLFTCRDPLIPRPPAAGAAAGGQGIGRISGCKLVARELLKNRLFSCRWGKEGEVQTLSYV
jgi:hypothetical protein